MTDLPATHAIGANKPPLDDAEALEARLKRDGADLEKRASRLELQVLRLPAQLETEEEAAKVTDTAAALAILIKDTEKFHQEEKAPYLAASRVVDGFKTRLTDPLAKAVAVLKTRLKVYQDAQRARAEAEAAQRAQEERDRQAAALKAERDAREAAAAAEKALADAAAAMRASKSPEERDAAERAMRDAGVEAGNQRNAADAQTDIAAEAERTAATATKVATGVIAGASKVTGSGASAGGSHFWNHRIDDPDAVLKSLGPWAPYFSNDAVTTAINAAKRELGPATRKATPKISLPGVTFFVDFRTSIQTARR
jgi:Xaa-Pro aminopeptidase